MHERLLVGGFVSLVECHRFMSACPPVDVRTFVGRAQHKSEGDDVAANKDALQNQEEDNTH